MRFNIKRHYGVTYQDNDAHNVARFHVIHVGIICAAFLTGWGRLEIHDGGPNITVERTAMYTKQKEEKIAKN